MAIAILPNDKAVTTCDWGLFSYGTQFEHGTPISHEIGELVLGYEVQKEVSCRPNGEIVPNQFHLVRMDGDGSSSLLNTTTSVGNEFSTAAQPRQVLEFGEALAELIPGLKLETVATMHGGATQMLCLCLGDALTVYGDKSPRYDHIIIHNPLTRGRLSILAHNVRVVCENTLQAALTTGVGYRISHTKNSAQAVNRALDTLHNHALALKEMNEKIAYLASRNPSVSDVNAMLDRLVPLPAPSATGRTNGLTLAQNKRNEILNQFETDDSFTQKSYWAFANSATYLLEHPLHKQERVDLGQVKYENLTGARSAEKSRIFDAVYGYAKGDVIDVTDVIVA